MLSGLHGMTIVDTRVRQTQSQKPWCRLQHTNDEFFGVDLALFDARTGKTSTLSVETFLNAIRLTIDGTQCHAVDSTSFAQDSPRSSLVGEEKVAESRTVSSGAANDSENGKSSAYAKDFLMSEFRADSVRSVQEMMPNGPCGTNNSILSADRIIKTSLKRSVDMRDFDDARDSDSSIQKRAKTRDDAADAADAAVDLKTQRDSQFGKENDANAHLHSLSLQCSSVISETSSSSSAAFSASHTLSQSHASFPPSSAAGKQRGKRLVREHDEDENDNYNGTAEEEEEGKDDPDEDVDDKLIAARKKRMMLAQAARNPAPNSK